MGISKLGQSHPATCEQWQQAFIVHATKHCGMDVDTATYEAGFAADDQGERVGPDARLWEAAVAVASQIAGLWDRRLLCADDADAAIDFNFDFDFGKPLPPAMF
jgi:hypothetical protein